MPQRTPYHAATSAAAASNTSGTLAHIARAVDEHAPASRRRRRYELAEETEGDATPGQHHEKEHRVEDEDGARESLEAECEEEREHARDRAAGDRLRVGDKVVEAD